jgi:hypothetical protein
MGNLDEAVDDQMIGGELSLKSKILRDREKHLKKEKRNWKHFLKPKLN